METGITLEKAQQVLLDLVAPRGETCVSLFEAAGRILSQDVKAEKNIPSFDRSPLDGYAMRAVDIAAASRSNPVSLRVIEEIAAGYVAAHGLSEGTTIKVMTGAPIPEGADVVIKYEDVKRSGETIQVYQKLKSGSNIVPEGEDVKKGEVIARRGTRITPPVLGLIASLGIYAVPVFSKVKVALLSTGDELLEPSEEIRPGKIYNSNLYTLQAQCQELGVEPISLGIVADNQEAIAEQILKGIQEADLVITTGGVSVGDYDLVQNAVDAIGAQTLYWKVLIKPGSAMLAAVKDNTPIIGLSGNPASSLITFDLIVLPLLKKMLGQDKQLPAVMKAFLSEDFRKPSPQRRFLRGSLHKQNGQDYIKLTGVQANGVLKSMIGCNVLVDVPAGCQQLAAGDEVSAYIIGHIDDFY